MKQRIMILGAGVYQVPLIKKAKAMGLETIVISPRGRYPGIPLADVFLDINTTDADTIVLAAKKFSITGIVTTGSDVCMPSLGKVVDELDLAGTGYEAACRSMDKVRMKKTFKDRSVPTADFQVFTDINDAQIFANFLGYPVMVKAPDSSGSRGITKVSSKNDFQAAWDRAIAVSRSKKIIVEQFLWGVEFGAQALINGNYVEAVFPHRDTVTPAPYFSPIGHSMPTTLTENQQKKTAIIIEQAVQALGIKDCVSNVDLMLVDDEPKIIEIGSRMGATCLPENISIYAGKDIYEHLIKLSLGERPTFEVTARQANASLLLRSCKTGSVAALEVPDEVSKHPDLIELQWDIGIGDYVREFKTGPDRIGHIIVKADTSVAGEELVQWLASQVIVRIVE